MDINIIINLFLVKNKIKSTLNDKGLSLYNKRDFALKQQLIMTKESDKSQKIEMDKDGLVILCAFYGDNVEMKLFDAVRKYLNLDNNKPKEQQNVNQDEEEDDDDKEEEKTECVTKHTTDNGAPPPLLFDIYGNAQKSSSSSSEEEERIINDNNKYKIEICDVDWLLIEKDIEEIMLKTNVCEDATFPSFINVRIVLQYMVNNDKSILELSSGNKSYLPGFYDCSPNKYRTKQLLIIYKYRNDYRYITISDIFPLKLPNKSHLSWFNCRQTSFH